MHFALSLTEGRLLRDLFYNGFQEHFFEAGHALTIFSEAARVPSFGEEWKHEQVQFQPLSIPVPPSGVNMAHSFRRIIARKLPHQVLKYWLKQERKHWYPPRPEHLEYLKKSQTKVIVTTNSHLNWEAELLSAGNALGLPTLGLVKSWDNVHKGIACRPDVIAVWNDINKHELVEMEGFEPDKVHVIGPPAFDAYFQQGIHLSREEFAEKMGLDPNRPILLFATLGYFIPHFDETCWMEKIVEMLDNQEIPGHPQVICRLHPWSRYEHFQKFAKHPDVRLSWVNRYLPGLTWYMTKEDVAMFANMIVHADVVITPGSTLVLEAAIFDRPTLVPMFHQYQPERAADYFKTWVLGKHYAHIVKNDLVPFIREAGKFAVAIKKCLEEPAWYRSQREQLVKDYVQFTDGKATERFAKLAMSLAGA